MTQTGKVCPECGYEFRGNGWDGIDAHWRGEHATIMRYEEAWPLISAGKYLSREAQRGDLSEAIVTSANGLEGAVRQPLRIALFGFGTVGSSVARILVESKPQGLELTHIFNRGVAR